MLHRQGRYLLVLMTVIILSLSSVLFAIDPPHNNAPSTNVSCLNCHNPGINLSMPGIDNTPTNIICRNCHNEGGSAAAVATHSAYQTGDSEAQKYWGGAWTNQCIACHNPHTQEQARSYPGTYPSGAWLYTGTIASSMSNSITVSGTPWTSNQWQGYILHPKAGSNYFYRISGNTEDTITVEKDMFAFVRKAGNTFAISYGKLVRAEVNTGDDADRWRAVTFLNSSSSESFAEGDADRDGACEVCHRLTSHFRKDGTGPDPLHDDIGGGAGRDCMPCHSHAQGFGHGDAGGGGCGTATTCHGTTKSHPTHVNDSAGKGLSADCSECHDTTEFPYFKTGVDSDGDGNYSLSETDVCDACHSPAGSYDGVNDPAVGAKNNWPTGVYSDNALKAGKEKWCATCHDESPSGISAVSAPPVIGNETDAYTYGTGWGYYKTGHGLPGSQTYPASGGITAGAGRECDACHDFSTDHIDGLARTFDDGDSTSTDPGVYRSGYRLKRVLAGTGTGTYEKEPMFVPWSQNVDNSANIYRLCVNCHDPEPFLGISNATNFMTDGVNRHEYHLVQNSYRYRADWSGANNSRMTCVTCHNVHGSTRLAMIRDGKLVNSEPGLMIWYYNAATVTCDSSNPNPPVPENLPLSASTGTCWRSATSGNLCSHCHNDNNTTPEYRAPFQNTAQGPTLDWTGEANFVTDGAHPDSAASGSSFEFRVKYTDTNDDPPSAIEVWVDKDSDGLYDAADKIALAEADGGDSTYYDGKIFTNSVALDTTGGNVKKYRFYAESNATSATGPPTGDSSVYVLDSAAPSANAPVLDWTGEVNFVTDGAHPDSAASGSSFEFRVKYTDADNDAPALMQLWVDADRDGAYSDGEKHAMSEDGGAYSTGMAFTNTLTLACAGGCSIDYRFYATDGTNEATGDPVSESTVIVTNNAPSLAWTGEADYTADGVNPDSGEGGTASFEFRVDYADADGSPPSLIQVWVDKDDSGDYSDYEKYDLAAVDGDTDYTDGKRYATTMSIPYVGDGDISYRFHASDGTDDAAGPPASDSSLTVTAPTNNAPSMSWATANCLSNGVRPPNGVESENFEFQVVYTDSDNQCPSGTDDIVLWVDEDDNGAYGPDEKHVLSEYDSLDVDCTDGKLYGTTIQLVVAGDGALNYRFFATDGYEEATGAPTSDSTATVMYAVKVRPGGGDGWYSSIQDAVNASTDPSTILVYPNADFTAATYNEKISVINYKHNRTIQSACGADLTTIVSTDTYTTVLFQDSNNGVMDGFSLTGATNSAGFYVNRGTSVTIRNSRVYGNLDGIIVNNGANPVNIENTKIYDNTSNGVYSNSGTSSTAISGSEIYSNGVSDSGAGVYYNYGVHTITGSVIRNNTTSAAGAAITFNGTGAGTTVTDTVISDNTSTGNVGGGMYINNDAKVDFYECTITGNRATVNVGGAMYINGSNATFENCIIADNQGTQGGAIDINTGSTSFINVTFADNEATTGNGGAFYVCNSTNNVVRNSIFWNNTAAGSGDNAYKACGSATFMTITDSDVTTGAGYIDGGTVSTEGADRVPPNIDPAQDPLFVGGGDYHIQNATSPVIDEAGATYAPDTDIDGDSRPQGSGDDMGADEYVSP